MSQFGKANWQVISVALLIKNQKILLGLRQNEKNKKKDLWEFPGGGVELGELPQDTMIRELEEELSIQVRKSEVAGCLCDYKKEVSRLIVFFYVESWEGKIQNNYHQKLAWLSFQDCRKKRLPNINPQLFDNIMELIGKKIR